MRLLALFGLVSFAAACGNDTVRPSGATQPLVALLKGFKGTTALYAPTYEGPPPAGERLRISIHDEPSAAACSFYGTGVPSGAEIVFLRLTFTSAEPGTYAIVPHVPSTPGETAQASARLIKVVNGNKVATYTAASGSIRLDPPVKLAGQWDAGNRVHASLAVDFTDNPIVSSECRGGQAKGQPAQLECTCTSANGDVHTCVPSGTSDCCVSMGGGSLPFTLQTDAVFCADLCAFVDPSLARHCTAVRQ